MKNRRNWLGILVILLVLGIMVIGCELPDEVKIVGVWEDWPVVQELRFNSNNTGSISVMGRGTNTFSYELHGNTIEITGSNGVSYTGNFRIDYDYSNKEDRLIISDVTNLPPLSALYFINSTLKKKN